MIPTMTPAAEPTVAPTEEPTVLPTNPPRKVEAPFAMVSPVPNKEITDIVGTMTVDTYPKVDGSTATLPLSYAVFMAATGESDETAANNIAHTKTTNSYQRLYDGEVDLLIVYEPAESIVERMKTEPLCIKPIGLDALVFLANAANPVSSLSMEQLVDIYSGKISNWSDVGGNDKELLAFQRPVGSGSQTLMKDTEMMSGDNVFRYGTMSDILEGMLSYNYEDNTLGYSVFYYANNMYFEKDLKLMGVDGVIPSTQTIYDGSYQLTNAFYAVVRTDEPTDSNARKIFDWLTGEAGQQLILELGYVPVQMPAGSDISYVKAQPQEKTEVLAKKPLKDGQYFVFGNPQNLVSDYYYGAMTVYNSRFEEIASFYNVKIDQSVQGIYTNRYLPIGQIRQNEDGEQKMLYGIFDLEKGAYSVKPGYSVMEVLDAERGYFAMPRSEDNWMEWMVINGTGEVILNSVRAEEWLMIWKFGNGYQELRFDYENWEYGSSYYYYDEELQLRYVFCSHPAAIPDDNERIPGVQYILMEGGGCLVDADGNVILNTGIFLERFGDGEHTECELGLHSLSLAEENKLYAVKYCNQIFLLDSNLNAVRVVYDETILESFDSADFYENFCSFYDRIRNEWVYRTYDGTPMVLSDGLEPDDIQKSWTNNSYLMYKRENDRLLVEEHTPEGETKNYTILLKDATKNINVYYSDSGHLILSEETEEQVQSPYYEETVLVPRCVVSLYYKGVLLAEKYGLDDSSVYALDEEHYLWNVRNGNRLTAPSESLFEEFSYSYPLGSYTMLNGDRSLYEIDDAYLLYRNNKAASFIKGNYIYVVGYDGTEYIKALHTFMSTD